MPSLSPRYLITGLVALTIVCAGREALSSSMQPGPVRLEKGTRLWLNLVTPLNSATTLEGDGIVFHLRNDIRSQSQTILVPNGTIVRGIVSQVAPAFVNGKRQDAKIRVQVNEIPLDDGTSVVLETDVIELEAEHLGPSGIRQALRGAQGPVMLGTMTGMASGRRGALIGTGVGIGVGLGIGVLSSVGEVKAPGSDIDLQPGDIFLTSLRRDVDIPDLGRFTDGAPVELRIPTPPVAPGTAEAGPAAAVPFRGDRENSAIRAAPRMDTPGGGVPAGPPPSNGTTPGTEVETAVSRAETDAAFSLSVDVEEVLVDAVVRDRAGRPITNLTPGDFRLFEDGVEQEIRGFSREKLPLALALVVDRSGSVAPLMREVEMAAFQALDQLEDEDAVSLFSFADDVQLVEELTTDRRRVAARIGGMRAGGGTQILDAVDEALRYLGRAAPDRRRAVILISDNQQGRSPTRVDAVVGRALETESVIYSVKVIPNGSFFGSPIPGLVGSAFPTRSSAFDPVPHLARYTGGEVFEATASALDEVLAMTVARLKLRYTLTYRPATASDDRYHAIEVRLADRFGRTGSDYTVHSRSGYYEDTAGGDRQAGF